MAAINNKGIILKKLKEYDKAIVCYDYALEISPKDFKVINNKGNVYDDL